MGLFAITFYKAFVLTFINDNLGFSWTQASFNGRLKSFPGQQSTKHSSLFAYHSTIKLEMFSDKKYRAWNVRMLWVGKPYHMLLDVIIPTNFSAPPPTKTAKNQVLPLQKLRRIKCSPYESLRRIKCSPYEHCVESSAPPTKTVKNQVLPLQKLQRIKCSPYENCEESSAPLTKTVKNQVLPL
jgi:hypothetical protein